MVLTEILSKILDRELDMTETSKHKEFCVVPRSVENWFHARIVSTLRVGSGVLGIQREAKIIFLQTSTGIVQIWMGPWKRYINFFLYFTIGVNNFQWRTRLPY